MAYGVGFRRLRFKLALTAMVQYVSNFIIINISVELPLVACSRI